MSLLEEQPLLVGFQAFLAFGFEPNVTIRAIIKYLPLKRDSGGGLLIEILPMLIVYRA